MDYSKFYRAGGLWPEELEKIHSFILKNNVKSIVEIGAGFSSTTFFNSLKINVTSYETSNYFINILKEKIKTNKFKYWDGTTLDIVENPDVIFIDGPKGAANREVSIIEAANKKCNLIVHDYSSDIIQKFCNKHFKNHVLEEYFFLEKGTGICNLAFFTYEE